MNIPAMNAEIIVFCQEIFSFRLAAAMPFCNIWVAEKGILAILVSLPSR